MIRLIRLSKRTWLIAAVGVCLFAGPGPARRDGERGARVARRAPECRGRTRLQRLQPDPERPASRKLLCTDIRGIIGHNERFYDNGHYIGHDEPSIRFLSNRPGSGNNVTFTETLPRDPAAMPTVTPSRSRCHPLVRAEPRAVVRDEHLRPELLPADGTARPTATTTRRTARSLAAAPRSWRCSSTRPASPRSATRSAATTPTGARRSTSTRSRPPPPRPEHGCDEPVNFAFIQRNGVPAGPPSPQLSNGATFTPNSQTLMMNPGDVVRTHMWDASIGGGKRAFKIVDQRPDHRAERIHGRLGRQRLHEHSTTFTCSGTPFNFQPLFNTARVAELDRLVGAAVRHPHPVRDRPLHPVQARHRARSRSGSPTPPGRTATGPTRTRGRPTAPRRARKRRTPCATRRATRTAGRRRPTWSPAAWTLHAER